MNMKQMTTLLDDQSVISALRKCTSVNELVIRLNRAGAECTLEEGKKLLRAWNKYANDFEERESMDIEDMDMVAGKRGFVDYIKTLFVCTPPQPKT